MAVKLAISFQTEEHLCRSHRKDKSNLRSDAADPGFDRTQDRSRSAIGRELVIEIADRSHEELF